MRLRLGVSPAPVGLNGPVIVSDWMCGRPVQSSVSTELRRNCCSRRVSPIGRLRMNAAPTDRGPAFTWTREDKARLDPVARILRFLEHHRQVGVAADGRQMYALPVDPDFDLVWIVEPAQVAEVGLLQPDLEPVFAVQREGVADHQSAGRPERQPLEVLVL